MINTIIFDIGMVLVDFDWKSYLNTFSFEPKTYTAVANAVFLSPVWLESDRGAFSEDELLLRFIQNAPGYEEEIRKVYDNLGGCIHQYHYAIPWITALKEKGYRIYALSNYGERLYKQTQKELSFLDVMDGALISYREHLIKPDPSIYETLFNRYNISPAEAVFLDDNLDNIKGAANMGLHTIHFTGYEDALQQLEVLLRQVQE